MLHRCDGPRWVVAVPVGGLLDWSPYNWATYGKGRFEVRWSNDGGTIVVVAALVGDAVEVYFTVTTTARAAGKSSTLRAAPPTVSGTGSRTGSTITVVGATRNIVAGSTVKPWIKVNGSQAVSGTPLTTDSSGAFTWTYKASAGDSVSVRFNVRGVKSEPIKL